MENTFETEVSLVSDESVTPLATAESTEGTENEVTFEEELTEEELNEEVEEEGEELEMEEGAEEVADESSEEANS